MMVRLEELTIIRAPIERCFDLGRTVEVHLAGNIHSGESAVAAAGMTSAVLGPVRRDMRKLLRERNGALKTIAESSQWEKYLP